MQLRTRLSIMFSLITVLVLSICSFTIYYFSSRYREAEFEERLQKKINATARLYADIDEVDARLLRIIQQQELGILPNEQITIHSLDGKLLYRSDELIYFKVSKSFIDKVIQNNEYFEYVGMYEVFGKTYEGKSGTYVFVVGGYDKFGFSKLRNLRNVLISVTFGGAIILAVSGWLYAGRALKPIDSLIRQASEMSPDKLDVRLLVGENKDELSRMAEVFNQLLERIELAFKSHKTFVANASHELRTPLTLISGQLEVLLMKERSNTEYKNSAVSVLEDIRRLSRISNRLLLLAQTEKSSEQLPVGIIRIDELLWTVKSELTKNNTNYKLHIQFEYPDENESWITTKGNTQLLETAFINLAENSCKFSENHVCKISASFTKEQMQIDFIDHGIGIPEEEQELIFQPFFRSNNAIQFAGHGLGLAMVKRIIDLHNGNISIKSRIHLGTTISVILKSNI